VDSDRLFTGLLADCQDKGGNRMDAALGNLLKQWSGRRVYYQGPRQEVRHKLQGGEKIANRKQKQLEAAKR